MGQALPGQRAERPATPPREARSHPGPDDPLRPQDRAGPADPGALGARATAAHDPRPAARPGPRGRPPRRPAGRTADGAARPDAPARDRARALTPPPRRVPPRRQTFAA